MHSLALVKMKDGTTPQPLPFAAFCDMIPLHLIKDDDFVSCVCNMCVTMKEVLMDLRTNVMKSHPSKAEYALIEKEEQDLREQLRIGKLGEREEEVRRAYDKVLAARNGMCLSSACLEPGSLVDYFKKNSDISVSDFMDEFYLCASVKGCEDPSAATRCLNGKRCVAFIIFYFFRCVAFIIFYFFRCVKF